MLCDSLLAAERGGFRLRGGVKPSRAMEDLDAYVSLTDFVFDAIKAQAFNDPKLKEAAALIDRVETRRLYVHAGEVVVPARGHELVATDDADILEGIARCCDDAALRARLREEAFVDKFSINFGMKSRNPVEHRAVTKMHGAFKVQFLCG